MQPGEAFGLSLAAGLVVRAGAGWAFGTVLQGVLARDEVGNGAAARFPADFQPAPRGAEAAGSTVMVTGSNRDTLGIAMSTQLTERPVDTAVPAAEPDWVRGAAATDPLWGSPPPPAGDTAASSGGGRRWWSRRLAAGLLVVGLAVSSGTAGAYAATRLEGHTTTTSTSTASSLASVAAAVKQSVVTMIVRSASQEAEGSGIDERAFTRLVGNYGDWGERNSQPDAPSAELYSTLVLGRRQHGPLEISGLVTVGAEADRLLDEHLAAVNEGVGVPHTHDTERKSWLAHALDPAPGLAGVNLEHAIFKLKDALLRKRFTDRRSKSPTTI